MADTNFKSSTSYPPPVHGDGRQQINFLVIGNSITQHGIGEYWWGLWGMAATQKSNDFVHVIANYLSKNFDVNFDIFNFFQWELMHYDRAETLAMLNKFHGKNYDFIVIQLGENVNNSETFEKDFFELIKNIREKISAGAKIFVVGNFWRNEIVDFIKFKISLMTGSFFVNLMDIQSAEFAIGTGVEVFGDDGKKHLVTHSGVAKHPNDKAMRICAERILHALH